MGRGVAYESGTYPFNPGENFELLKATNPYQQDGDAMSWKSNNAVWYYVKLEDGRGGILFFFPVG